MAPAKRKAQKQEEVAKTTSAKKSKNGKSGTTQEAKDVEYETDSDPIVESDTGSQSGDNDGASWPSEESAEENEVEVAGGVALNGNEDHEISANKNGSKTNQDFAQSNNTASRESHAKQKLLAQERKAAKPNADSIARAKKLWEKLRLKSHVPREERKKLVEELFSIITGRATDFVFKHDSVRAVQTALKYANLDQRKTIAKELKGEYKALAESKYAKFLIGKILVHGDKEIRDLVVPEFYGHVRKMIKHPEASWILDDVYRGAATPSQKAVLLREWYGAEFALSKGRQKNEAVVTADLVQILSQNPEKRKPVMHALYELINLLVQKKTTGFTMLHDAMLQYFLNLQPDSEDAGQFMEMLKGDEEGDLLKNLAFTQHGSRLVCLALARGTAKDRKLLLRAFKGTITLMAFDQHAHKVILTAFDVIDDTVMTAKFIGTELLGKNKAGEMSTAQQDELLGMVNNLNARAVLTYVFCGPSKAIMSIDDLKSLGEVQIARQQTSKKDPDIRRKELVAALSPQLLELINHRTKDLVSSSFGCQFITEVLLKSSEDGPLAFAAILEMLQQDDGKESVIFDTPAAGRMLKTLVQGGHYDTVAKQIQVMDPPLEYGNTFYSKLEDDGNLRTWATGVNSFVLVGLLEAPSFSNKAALMNRLRSIKQYLKAAAELSSSEKKHKKETITKGNAGAKILLQKLESST